MNLNVVPHQVLLLLFVKIISIPDEDFFSETYIGSTASYFV